ncbi:MAG: putative toxin-antitoxin system toxin component, PIN family [archaeon]|nr:putative toxin-antitoxin system toxin component, PIN family [archaeon]
MVKAVFDTNVLVSSLIRSGKPRHLWNKVIKGEVELIISREIFSEFNDVARRLKLRRYVSLKHLRRFNLVLIRIGKIVEVRTHLPQITEDPDDNMIIETALDGRADYIVSGDKHLLMLKEFKGIKIIDVEEMLKILASQP